MSTEAVSAPRVIHPSPWVGPVGRRVKPGHIEFDQVATDRWVFVLCTGRATELLVVALLTAATWKRRWKKNDESRDERGERSGVESEKQEKRSQKFDQFNRHVVKLKPFFRSESMVNAGRSIQTTVLFTSNSTNSHTTL